MRTNHCVGKPHKFKHAKLESLIMNLPPFKYLDIIGNRLQNILNEHGWAFNESPIVKGSIEDDNDVEYHQHFYTRFGTDDWDEPDELGEIFELNDKLNDFAVKIADLP